MLKFDDIKIIRTARRRVTYRWRQIYRNCLVTLQFLTLEMFSGSKSNFRKGSIRWQISMSIKFAFDIFCSNFHVSEIITFGIPNFENVGQRHRVKEWHHSITNINIYTAVWRIFEPALTVSEILAFATFEHWKSKSTLRSIIFAMAPFDGRCQNM